MAANPFAEFATPAADNPFAEFATRSEIPTGRKLTREELIAQIPGEDGKPVPAPAKPKPSALTFGNIASNIITHPVRGSLELLEVPLAVGANMITGAPIYLSGGMPEVQNWLQENIAYQPRGQLAQETLNALGKGMEATKLPPYMPGMITAPRMVSPTANVVRYGKAATKQAVAEIPAVAARTERLAQEASTKAWERAPQIEAAKKAPEYGIALDPSMSNPTVATQVGVGAVGQKGVQYGLSQKNLPKWNEAARKDLGLPANTPLDEAALNKYMERNSTSDLVIDKMGTLENTKDSLAELKGLLLDERRTSDKAKFAAVNEVVNRARDQVAEGLTGSEIMDQIRGLRHDAKVILRQMDVSPDKKEVALTKLKIANAFENLIENNLTDKSIIDLYRKERTAKAKGFDWERAIDPITKQVDPNQLAADMRNGVKLTGTLADLAEIAGAFPEIASMRPLATPDLYTNLRRGGAGGTIGFATLGGPEGAAIGAGVTSVAGRMAAKKIASPKFQQKYAVPADKRLPLPELQGMSRPDFVMQGTPYSPVPPTPNKMLGYNPNVPSTAEVQMNRLRAEDAMGQEFIRRQIMAEEAQQAAAEAAARRPTSGEILFDLDPITGRLVPAQPQGTALPQMSALESAVQKMSGQMVFEPLPLAQRGPVRWTKKGEPVYKSQTIRPEIPASEFKKYALPTRQGQAFAMTAEEKIAWNKTKADLAEVMPGMKSLSDEAIATKMMDRDWTAKAVQNAYAKAEQLGKQEAALAEQLANRDNLRLMAREIEAKQKQLAKIKADRADLRDLAEQMEETLRAPRPVSTGGQGPKTRAFQRNKLNMLSDQEALNKLLGK